MNRFKADTRTEFSDLCAEPKILLMFMRGCGRQKPEKIQKLRMIKRKLPRGGFKKANAVSVS